MTRRSKASDPVRVTGQRLSWNTRIRYSNQPCEREVWPQGQENSPATLEVLADLDHGRPSLRYDTDMRTISVSVSTKDYEAFRRTARLTQRPIAQLIREAMAFYRQEKLEARPRLTALPVLSGHSPVSPLPSRAELYDEVFGEARGAKAS